MQEILDIYDNNGNVTGKTIVRGDKNVKLEDGEHIALSVIFIENSNNEFLIQHTSPEKGNVYSTTGGHVLSKETPFDAIKREVNEELGIDISNDIIEHVVTLNYDLPLRYVYYLKKDIDLNDITIQEEEVDSVNYMNIDEIYKHIEDNAFLKSHAIQFKEVLKMKNYNKTNTK